MFFRSSKSKGEDAAEAKRSQIQPSRHADRGGALEDLQSAEVNTGRLAAKTDASSLRELEAQNETYKSFGMAARLLANSQEYGGVRLVDLNWFLMPAVQSGQYILAQGRYGPAGLLLWARVSQEVDAQLRSTPDQLLRLQPDEWQSGQNCWVTAVVGEEKVMKALFAELTAGPFNGRRFSMRIRKTDGSYRIVTVQGEREKADASHNNSAN